MANEIYVSLKMTTEMFSGLEAEQEQQERLRSLENGIKMYKSHITVSHNEAKAFIEEEMRIHDQKEINELREMFISKQI